MIRLIVDPRRPDAGVIAEAASVIREGGIVAFPTDTLYGLATDPRNPRAVSRLFAAKGRAADRAIALIANDAARRGARRAAHGADAGARQSFLAGSAHVAREGRRTSGAGRAQREPPGRRARPRFGRRACLRARGWRADHGDERQSLRCGGDRRSGRPAASGRERSRLAARCRARARWPAFDDCGRHGGAADC